MIEAYTSEPVKVKVLLDNGFWVEGTATLRSDDFKVDIESDGEYCVYDAIPTDVDCFECEDDYSGDILDFKVLEDLNQKKGLYWEMTDEAFAEYTAPDEDQEYERMREMEW